MNTREEWLNAAVELFRPRFIAAGKPLPDKLRVSVGWPHKARKGTIGQCFQPSLAADAVHQIFISPVLDDPTGPQGVLATLLHECAHAALPPKSGHRQPFKQLIKELGLLEPATATQAGPELQLALAAIYDQLGPFPHAALHPSEGAGKQSTRLVKCECPECGYTIRVTRKWLDMGAPWCKNGHHSRQME